MQIKPKDPEIAGAEEEKQQPKFKLRDENLEIVIDEYDPPPFMFYEADRRKPKLSRQNNLNEGIESGQGNFKNGLRKIVSGKDKRPRSN